MLQTSTRLNKTKYTATRSKPQQGYSAKMLKLDWVERNN